MGTPSNGLHGSCVLRELSQGLVTVEGPNHKLVVVAARGQLLVVKAPLESAHFLLVAQPFTVGVVGAAQITL